MTLDETNNATPPDELEGLNEKNLEGRVERNCWENQQRKNKLVVDLSKQLKTWGEIMPQPNAWISGNNEEMQNSTSKEYGELLHFETQEEKILEFLQQSLDELLKNELNHEEPPWRTPVTKGWWDRNEGWNNKMSLAMI